MSSSQTSEKLQSELERRIQVVEDRNKDLQNQIKQLKTVISEKENSIVLKLETITDLQKDNAKLKSELENYEEKTNLLNDSLTKANVENGELEYKIKQLEMSRNQVEENSKSEHESNSTRLGNLNTRINDLENENTKLRKTINDLNANESNLVHELLQSKTALDRIKREKSDEKDQLIEDSNKQLEDFNNETQHIKHEIKRILFE